MNLPSVVANLESKGVRMELSNGSIRIDAPRGSISEETVEFLRSRRAELVLYLNQSKVKNTFEPWALAEWRRISIPDWRRILAESIEKGDESRKQYAKWMLKEVLLDPECEGEDNERQ